MQQKLVKFFFLRQKAGAFGNNKGKKPQKPRSKLKSMHSYYIFAENICFACNPMQAVVYCKNILIL